MNFEYFVGRRSISSKHNKSDNKSSSFTKSFANTKKEELMKVINEAKQKLENVSRPFNQSASSNAGG